MSTSSSAPPPVPARAAPACPTDAPANLAPPGQCPRWCSRHLLAGGDRAEIAHGGHIYRLQQTALGKLILTK